MEDWRLPLPAWGQKSPLSRWGQDRPPSHQWESGLTCHGCAFSSEVGAVETLERTEQSRTRPQGLPWDSIRALRPRTLDSQL